jgi:hypothetical protein
MLWILLAGILVYLAIAGGVWALRLCNKYKTDITIVAAGVSLALIVFLEYLLKLK